MSNPALKLRCNQDSGLQSVPATRALITVTSGKASAVVPGAGGCGGGPKPLLFLPAFLLLPKPIRGTSPSCTNAEAQNGEGKVQLPFPSQPTPSRGKKKGNENHPLPLSLNDSWPS